MISKYFEDHHIGENARSLRARTITETDVVFFCYLTGNWFSIHSDVEFAKNTQFGQRIVQGALVFALAPGLQPTDANFVIANYGIDKLRFTSPVFIGDTIHSETEILDKQEKGPDRGVITFRQDMKNQRDQLVATMEWKLLVKRRPL